jgi:hypothetical protein
MGPGAALVSVGSKNGNKLHPKILTKAADCSPNNRKRKFTREDEIYNKKVALFLQLC